MTASVWPYELIPRRPLNARTGSAARQGALVRIVSEGTAGYADLHPWPEFGDSNRDEQLRTWRDGRPSGLVRRTLALAERDRQARAAGRSLLAGPQVKNNVLCAPGLDARSLRDQGVRTVKVKCGRDREGERSLLKSLVDFGELRIRLDFNSSLATAAEVAAWLALVPGLKTVLDYIEDPCPYDATEWSELRRWARVALDHEVEVYLAADPSAAPEADVFVWKPARPETKFGVNEALALGMNVTVTSMMDHAVGVVHALSFAEELRARWGERVGDAGCLTISSYEPDIFSSRLREEGPFLRTAGGSGIGFDELLATLAWEEL